MAERIVIWSETAIKQRNEIIKYWTTRNRSNLYSKKLLGIIEKNILLILIQPFSFQQHESLDYRICPIKNYSIVYKITDYNIKIYAFGDNRQDPKILLELLLQ